MLISTAACKLVELCCDPTRRFPMRQANYLKLGENLPNSQ